MFIDQITEKRAKLFEPENIGKCLNAHFWQKLREVEKFGKKIRLKVAEKMCLFKITSTSGGCSCELELAG